MLNSTAHQKLATVNPGTIASASRMRNALMTNKNNPKDIIVTGKVRMKRIGLTINCNRLITKATIMAVPYPATSTPGSNQEIRSTTTADNNN